MISKNMFLALALCAFSEGSNRDKEVTPEEPATDPANPEEPATDPAKPEEPATDPAKPEEPRLTPRKRGIMRGRNSALWSKNERAKYQQDHSEEPVVEETNPTEEPANEEEEKFEVPAAEEAAKVDEPAAEQTTPAEETEDAAPVEQTETTEDAAPAEDTAPAEETEPAEDAQPDGEEAQSAEEVSEEPEWIVGDAVEVYSRGLKSWLRGEVLSINQQTGYVRVKYGHRRKDLKPDSRNLRRLKACCRVKETELCYVPYYETHCSPVSGFVADNVELSQCVDMKPIHKSALPSFYQKVMTLWANRGYCNAGEIAVNKAKAQFKKANIEENTQTFTETRTVDARRK